MLTSSSRAFRAAAFLGFLGVALGAFGAHGLEKTFLLQPRASHWWETAVFYHLIHAVVLLQVSCLRPFPARVWILFAAGIVIFSGSLYTLALTGILWLGAVTPFGGICLLAAWLLLGLRLGEQGSQTQEED